MVILSSPERPAGRLAEEITVGPIGGPGRRPPVRIGSSTVTAGSRIPVAASGPMARVPSGARATKNRVPAPTVIPVGR